MDYARKITALLLAFSFLIPASVFAGESEPTAIPVTAETGEIEPTEYLQTQASSKCFEETFGENISTFFTSVILVNTGSDHNSRNNPRNSRRNSRSAESQRHNSNGLGIGITGQKKERKEKSRGNCENRN